MLKAKNVALSKDPTPDELVEEYSSLLERAKEVVELEDLKTVIIRMIELKRLDHSHDSSIFIGGHEQHTTGSIMIKTLTPQEAEKAPWFHSIDLGDGFISKSRFKKNVPPNYTLFGFFDVIKHLDIANCRCLDIGTMDGISSFVMKGLGASKVIATDIGSRNTFAFARERLGLDVEYVTDTDLYNISDKISGKFDVVLMAGILYHVFDPLYAITVARYLTKNNGFAIIETHFLKHETRPIMVFNPGDEEPIEQANFFWRASPSCLEAMFSMCSFRVVARRDIGKRVTYLLKAVRPSEMTHVNAITRKVQKEFMQYKHYRENIDFNALEKDTDEASARLITDPKPHAVIDVKKYKPEVPYQPKWKG